MRDFSFIHATEDVPRVLSVAADVGLIIRDGGPTADPGPIIVEKTEFPGKDRGQLISYLEEWIFGKFPVYGISAGAYRGKYDISPGTNASGIYFYFMGESGVAGECRLGNGELSRRIDWYSPEEHQIYSAPPEVKSVFDAICKRLITGKRVRAGGRTYHLLEGALRKIKSSYLPPFDFIAWPSELR